MRLIKSPPNNPHGFRVGDRIRHAYSERTGIIIEWRCKQRYAVIEWDDQRPRYEVSTDLLRRPQDPTQPSEVPQR